VPARAPLPPYHAQLALLVEEAPRGEGWLHEMKYDGYRIGCAVEGGRATLWSRRGKDWTAQFPAVADAARRLPVRSALLDGEVAVLLPDGRTSFQALQNAFGGGRANLVYFSFDLLHLDGEELSRLPIEERKARLERLLAQVEGEAGNVLRYAPHVVGGGEAVFREACKLGLEGIVSKRVGEPYRPGRNATWVKTKCVLRQELVIGGFTDPEGAARDAIGALLVGTFEEGALRFAGKVGTGFTNAAARALRKRLGTLAAGESPFTPRPAGWLGKNAHWVRPELVCEVAFTEWTGEGRIRHPSFQGLREDKQARDVRREAPAAAPGDAGPPREGRGAGPVPRAPASTRKAKGVTAASSASTPRTRTSRSTGTGTSSSTGRRTPSSTARRTSSSTTTGTTARPRSRKPAYEISGVRITNPERVMYPDDGYTKRDVARYYDAVADVMVPHLAGRPLTLFHCPKGLSGECHFMKHSKVWALPALRRVHIQEKTKTGEYLVADTPAALLSLAQMDVLELHTWNSTVDRLEEPDRIVLDLDPGPEVRFAEVVRAARTVRDALLALGLPSFVKTTGGAGLHVVVPLVPDRPWQECLAFARRLAEVLARHDPKRYTVAFAKAGRERKILIDYLRNNRTNTSVCAYSTRARRGAPVSVPLAWDELDPRTPPARFTLRTVPRRLATLGTDPWQGWERARRTLDRARQDALAGLPGAP
jgi:bifunctional non-homologous end joining protein LigD